MIRTASSKSSKTHLVRALVAIVLAFGLMPLPAFAQAEGGEPAQSFIAAASSEQSAEVDAYWYNFRNSENNMAIIDAKTPIDPDNTKLIWAKRIGYGSTAEPSQQLIVDNALIVTVGKTIYKLNLKTGEVLAQGAMAASNDHGIAPLTYAEGMIFAPINGGVQAFDAKTLESLWVYNAKLGGQATNQIVYSDGFLYTGFWVSETDAANYVCVSVTDEDPSQATEAKEAEWTDDHAGGFYNAGGVVVGNYIIVGSEDGMGEGETGTSRLRAYNSKGQLVGLRSLTGMGDQRSSIAWDAERNRVFFTTKSGFIASAAFRDYSGELFDLKCTDLNRLNLEGIGTDAQCTSTPIVYDGVLYVCIGAGADGAGAFVACNADTLKLLYAKPLKSCPQSSMLLSTAYKDSGFLYFYTTYNAAPGGLQMIKVPVGATDGDNVEVSDIYDAAGHSGNCICSPIAGPDGAIYYSNGSGTVFAIRSNMAPTLANGVSASTEATIKVGSTYRLDLSSIFTDGDGDPLTYTVATDGVAAILADNVYSFTPSAVGTTELVFTAKDAARSSCSYSVTLKVTPKENAADKKAAGKVSAMIAKLPKPRNATALNRVAANNAKKAYNALTAAQKAYVSKADVSKMNAVKKAADNEYLNGLAKGTVFKVTTKQGVFTYKVTAKKIVTLTKATATTKGGAVTINAAKYHGVSYKVTGIGAKAFNLSKLKGITLGNNVTTVGAQAFSSSKFLATFTVGKNVKKIGANAFSKTSKLTKLTVKSAKLVKKSAVANSLKGSSVKTVNLSGLTKSQKKKVTKAFASSGKKGVVFK